MKNSNIIQQNIKARWSMTDKLKINYDHLIYKKAIQWIKYVAKNKYIAIYWPRENEVDTIAIIDQLLKDKYKICLPFITSEMELKFKKINSIHFEYEWYKNLKMPSGGDTIIPLSLISILVLPIVVFNSNNFFLSYHQQNIYTNILSNKNEILKIGLAYDFQKDDEITINEENSNYVDKIITN